MNDPWAFGWTQLFTLVGLTMSGVVSVLGLRTFTKWQREKIHEKKLEIAFEALSLAYEATMVFDDIRRRFIHAYEWADMPTEGLDNEKIGILQSNWAIISRMNRHADFFQRLLKLQPKFLAVFGSENDSTFLKLHRARTLIQSGLDILREIPEPRRGTDEWDLILQARSDVWDHASSGVKEPHRVTKLLEEFRSEVEKKCAPFVNREFKS
jgi:hypothetical protein